MDEMALEKAEHILIESGFTLSQFIQHTGKRNSSLLSLPESDMQRFRELYDSIDRSALEKTEKGRALEQLVEILFETGGLFERRRDYRTSTNEIDLLLRWGNAARCAGILNSFPCFGEMFICECKNYKGKVNVTYVGKFYSLLAVSKVSFGVLVAWEGITGRGDWTDAKGLIRKIALCEGIYIVTLDKEDLRYIYDGTVNIYSLLLEKRDALQSDICYNKFISHHEAENAFSNKLFSE